jgi:hypothetical protein
VFALALSVVFAFSRHAAPSHVPHHFHDWDSIDYHAKIHKLCDTHIKNHRVRGTHTTWAMTKEEYKEDVSYRSEWENVYGEKAWIEVMARSRDDKSTDRFARYRTPDAIYYLGSDDGKVPFKVTQHAVEWKDHSSQYRSSFGGFLATRQVYTPEPNELLVSHEATTFDGRPALKLTTRKGNGITSTIHLDADTYQHLSTETDRSPDFNLRGRPGPEKTFIRVTYREANGRRYPTKYEHTRLQPDGVRRNLIVNEITEYVAHTPTADELDMEKRFGVKPPHEPRPPAFPKPPAPRYQDLDPPAATADSRIIDDPPVDHTPRYVLAALAVLALVVVLFFPFRRRATPHSGAEPPQ